MSSFVERRQFPRQRIEAAAEERLADLEMSAQLKEALNEDWLCRVRHRLRRAMAADSTG